ncbi:glutaminase A [Archangium lansingense]|uniref:Glutaminase n=1 Tax=Archangium lansingense TaxID=2995310 RepID=A0ABT4ACN4_9BACT|nr:glutaminase A [Archangium lansinium]MCY1079430.1 glutaminase A [Archangium lansinium]
MTLLLTLAAMGCRPPSVSIQPGLGARQGQARATSCPTCPLPTPEEFTRVLQEAYLRYKDLNEGKNADYIPALAKVDPSLFGIAIVTVKGDVYEVGQSQHPFAIESISKLFVLSRVMNQLGADELEKRVGVEPSGMPFNSVLAVELIPNHTANPFVNAGAMATTGLVRGGTQDERWAEILGTMEAFANRSLPVDQEVYRSESETNSHNKGIAQLLLSYGRMQGDVLGAVDLYTRQCSVSISARDLAVMGATLANEGVNPLSSKRVVARENIPHILAVMMMNGLYDASGGWAFRVGLPGKSGVGGGLVAVVPNRYAIAAFSPPLDAYGNSVRGQRAIEYIASTLGANVFIGTGP